MRPLPDGHFAPDTAGSAVYLPPATGQDRCYDAGGKEVACQGSGQDGSFAYGRAWPAPRFRVEGELAQDRLSGLWWPINANLNDFPLDWNEALRLAAAMNAGKAFGFADWRLPNRRELLSLLSYQARKPALPVGHPFRNIFLGWHWTSTTAAIAPSYAWYVHLEGGRSFYGRKDQEYLFWPVRGQSEVLAATGQEVCYDQQGGVIACRGSGQDGEFRHGLLPPEPRFAVAGETVRDRHTGLIWLRDADFFQQAMSWPQAMEGVARLNQEGAGGRGDWRLPPVNALESLVDCSRHSPALPEGHPFARVQEVYWSSTTSFFETDWAWALYLHKGALGVGHKPSANYSLWPVCGPG